MANSKQFRKLSSRMNELKRHFLPKTFDPTGHYSALQFDKVRAYRVLAHAEIEDFIEEISILTVDDAVKMWRLKQRTNKTLVSLAALYDGKKVSDVYEEWKATGSSVPKANPFDERINRITKEYSELIEKNHGIRDRNVIKML